jgi:hypothetical protein
MERNRVGRRKKKEGNTCQEIQLGQDRFKATAVTGTAGGLAVLGTPDCRVVI